MELKEIREKFNEFELKQKMFDLKDVNGNPIWDILRPYVYMAIINSENSEKTDLNISDNNHLSLIERLTFQIKRLLIVLSYFIFVWNKKYLVILCSRNIKNGVYYDKIAESLMENVDLKDMFIVESYIYYHQDKYKYKYKASLPMIESLLLHIMTCRIPVNEILEKLEKYFPKVSWSRELICDAYRKFYAQYYFYRLIIRCKHIKKCFIVQSGYQKGLFFAAMQEHVPVCEFQHGEITKNHIVYSYPTQFTKTDAIYKPTVLFTFGDFWLKDCNFPGVSIVSLGNDSYHINRNILKEDHSKDVLVVSDNLYGKYLVPLVQNAIKVNPANDIYYYFKLHPNQESEYNDYVEKFKDYSCVEVVKSTQLISEYLLKVAYILTIESTVEFEALSSGVKVIIYKRSFYQYVDSLFDEEGVYLIDNEKELIDTYRNHLNDQIKDYGNYFFKAFDREILRKYL